MAFEYQVPCSYCGQVLLLTGGADEPQEKLIEAAAMKCMCPQAQVHQGMRATEENIQEILGENGSGYRRFGYAIPEEGIAAVRTACRWILEEDVSAITMKLICGDEIRITRNKSIVKIKRSNKNCIEV